MQMQDRVPQARIYKVWNTPGVGDGRQRLPRRSPPRVLSRGKTSRLYKRLVYDDQIATEVSARQDARGDRQPVRGRRRRPRPGGDLAAVETAVDEELAALPREGPDRGGGGAGADRVPGRVRARRRADRRLRRQVGHPGARAPSTGAAPDFYKTRLERIQGATPADVWDAAEAVALDGVFVLEVHPFPEYAAGAAGADRSKRPEPARRQPPASRPSSARRSAQRAQGRAGRAPRRPGRQPPAPRRRRLRRRPGRRAGHGAPRRGHARRGHEDAHARSQISDDLARARRRACASSADLDTTRVSLSALKANLDPLARDLRRRRPRPVVPAGGLRAPQEAAARRASSRRRPSRSPSPCASLPRLLYGEGHAYAIPFTGSGTEASVSRLTRDDVARWHATWFKPNNATLVVVGRHDARRDQAEAREALRRLEAGRGPEEERGHGGGEGRERGLPHRPARAPSSR